MDFSVVRMCFYSAGSGGLFWYIHRLFVQCSRRREHKAYANEASASTGNCRDIFCCGLPFFLRLSVASRGYRCSFPNHNHLGSGVWMVCDAIYTLPALRIFFLWPHIYTGFFPSPRHKKKTAINIFVAGHVQQQELVWLSYEPPPKQLHSLTESAAVPATYDQCPRKLRAQFCAVRGARRTIKKRTAPRVLCRVCKIGMSVSKHSMLQKQNRLVASLHFTSL